MWLGELWEIDDTLVFTVATKNASTGAATDADSVPTYRVYEDETGTEILSGSMAKLDDSNTIGFYSETLTLSSGNGFETNKSYSIYAEWAVSAVVQSENFGFSLKSVENEVWDTILSGSNHNITGSSGKRLRQIQEAQGYMGKIWVSTLTGTAGTTPYEDGTVNVPVDNLPDALTLAAAVNLATINLAPGSVVQFVQPMNNLRLEGLDYTIDFNGQQMYDSTIQGAVCVGVITGNGGSLLLEKSKFGDVSLPNDTAIVDGVFAGTVTLSETGFYFFNRISSVEMPGFTPSIDFGAIGAQYLNIRNQSGALEFKNMSTGDVVYIEGRGEVVVNANCTGGSIVVRGSFHVHNNSNGSVAIDQEANVQTTTIHTGYARASTVNTIQLATDASSTDGAYDPALIFIVSGTGAGQTRLIYQYTGSTGIAVIDRDWKVLPDTTSQYRIIAHAGREHVNEGQAQGGTLTSITLNTLASSSDDAYKGHLCFVRSGTGEDQVVNIGSYDGTTKIATIAVGSASFTIAPDSTSGYVMLPAHIATASDSMAVIGAALAAYPVPKVADISTQIFESVDLETGLNLKELVRGMASVLLGEVSGAGSGTITFKSADGSVTRLVATVTTAGNRTGVTLSLGG